ncbi:hypothetical protein PM082_002350 [Marasmius tenuissimus]|nr:hypothetical protein PM082_002350 [Marasmius tenuissimus]
MEGDSIISDLTKIARYAYIPDGTAAREEKVKVIMSIAAVEDKDGVTQGKRGFIDDLLTACTNGGNNPEVSNAAAVGHEHLDKNQSMT